MEGPELSASVTSQDELTECSHFWLIDSPNGPTSIGRCQLCGDTRDFKNSVHVTSWESDGSHLHRSRGVGVPRSV